MISELKFKAAADIIGCEVATIKAVAEVESGGSGYLPDGQVAILFEPHVFWKELKKAGVDPNKYATKAWSVTSGGKKLVTPVNDPADPILYPVWVSGHYGPSSDQHRRLQKAVAIHRDAALKSASWGKFQILGTNHKMAQFATIQEFVTAMIKGGEEAHLLAFINYIQSAGLDDELRFKQWASFARGYNGSAYWKNKYDSKLAVAYKKYKK